ncbi:MAG: phosphatase PAP2 family protein [Myxococcales bacterium]|nr:phosphatase PAP2 family protein [Myxococcales bacterium]
MRLLAFVALTLAAMLPCRAVLADSPYQLRLEIDLPLIGLGLAGTSIALLEKPSAACLPSCSAEDINGFDSTVLGNYSESAHSIADVTVFGLLLAPLLLDLVDTGGDGWLEDATVFLQTILLTQATTQLTKAAVRRNAPFVYDESVPLDVRENDPDATRSFFSGHTATAFAASTAYTVTYWLRHPDDPLRWVVLATGGAIATTVGLLKVEAGYHFWTDVIAGAAVGTSIGTLVPILHHEF